MRPFRIPTALVALLLALLVVPAARAADPTPPAASTGSASSITTTGATIAGSVDPNNGATTFIVEYGTTSSYGVTTSPKDVGDGDSAVAVTAALTGLTQSTGYHYRIVATNAAGITRGADRTFTTARQPGRPTVGTFSANGTTGSSTVVGGKITPGGLATTVYVEFGTKTSYGTRTGTVALPATFSSTATQLGITGLQPFTTYHYRVVATNAAGTVRGSDRSFKTSREPTGLTLDPVATAVDWKGTVTISGKVAGAGGGSLGVTLERSDFPFSTTWVPRTLTTKSDGSFTTTVGPLYQTTRVRVVTTAPFNVASPWATIQNRVTVGTKTSNKTRTSITVSGRVFPQVDDGVATLQRQATNGRWIRVARGGVTASGQFASRYTFTGVKRPRSARQYRVRVVPNDAGAHISGLSRQFTIAGRR